MEEPKLLNLELPSKPPSPSPKKSPEDAIQQISQYFHYHNRLASFHDWPIEFEVDGAKPSPEALARAGFFSYHDEPHELDNVVCPYCKLFLDSWEPGDDPRAEHKKRSSRCDFVHGRERRHQHRAERLVEVPSELPEAPANRDASGSREEQEGEASASIAPQIFKGAAARRSLFRGTRGRGRGRPRGSRGATKRPSSQVEKAVGLL